MGSFAEFALARGKTVEQLAAALHLDPLLLQNVDLGRQAIPADVARTVAQHLGSTFGDVIAAARRWTPQEGPMPSRALPPDPLVQRLAFAPLARTQGGPSPVVSDQLPRQVWTAGQGLGGSGVGGAVSFGRDASPTYHALASTAFDTFWQFAALAHDGDHVYAFGSSSSGGYYAAKFTVDPPALVAEVTNAAFLRPCDAVYEPTSGNVWVSCAASTSLLKLDADLGVLASVTLTAETDSYGTQDFSANGVAHADGKVYACAYYDPGGGDKPDGRVFEVDAESGHLVRVLGENVGYPWGVCHDAARGCLWVTTDYFPTTIGAGLMRVDLATFEVTHVALSGPATWPGVSAWRWVSLEYDLLWVSGYESVLHCVDPSTEKVVRWRDFAGLASGLYAGRVASDPPSCLYAADPYTRAVHLLNYAHLEATALAVPASPDASAAYPISVLVVDPGVAPE